MANNKVSLKLDGDIEEFANDPEFVAERLSIKIVEEMLECLERKGLNQSWLAQRMGVSRAHISKILNAQPNMTLLTIAKIAVALGMEPDVSLDCRSRAKKTKRFLDMEKSAKYVPGMMPIPSYLEAREEKVSDQ